MSKSRFFDKKQLAEYLGLSLHTIDSWVSQRREIPYVKMGRRVLFDNNDVERWIEQNKVQPTDFGDPC
ncbi:MAG: helix-turn-helix domain-containing protein [candidate division Zixibacteria bacterium]